MKRGGLCTWHLAQNARKGCEVEAEAGAEVCEQRTFGVAGIGLALFSRIIETLVIAETLFFSSLAN